MVKMTRLSCHRFRSYEVRLRLSLIAYSLGNLWRWLVLTGRIGNWSLTSLRQRLVKTAAFDKARPELLAAPRGESLHTAAVTGMLRKNQGAAVAGWKPAVAVSKSTASR